MNVITLVTEDHEESFLLDGLNWYSFDMVSKEVRWTTGTSEYWYDFDGLAAASSFAAVLLDYLSGSRGVGVVNIIDKEEE